MGDQLKLDYYYGDEPEKFYFYRIPKVLFTKAYFADLSTDAKVLYGLMLDMMATSRSNRWVDKQNRVFIQFSVQRAMAYLGCSKGKAIKLFAELDTEKGIGLIERIDRGQGKADLIYVKSFEIPAEAEDNARIAKLKSRQQERTSGPTVQKPGTDYKVDNYVDNIHEIVDKNTTQSYGVVQKMNRSENKTTLNRQEVVQKQDQSENKTTLNRQEVVQKMNRYENRTPGSPKTEPLEVQKLNPNTNNPINNNRGTFMSSPSDCGSVYSRPIMVSSSRPRTDGQDIKEAYIGILKEQVRYGDLEAERPYCYEMDQVDGILNIIADIAATQPPDGVEWVNSRPYSHEVVKGRLLKTDYNTITHVLDRMNANTTQIRNMRGYLITALYNARDEMDMVISSQVNFDMYGGGRS